MKDFFKAGSVESGRRTAKWFVAWLIVIAVAVFNSASLAQQLTGTLSGTVYDPSRAVVPNANVVRKNQSSGDTRSAGSGSDGYLVITAVQPASYSITGTASGFSSWQE